jgi:tetratricopeptide (TPR) repeat protein
MRTYYKPPQEPDISITLLFFLCFCFHYAIGQPQQWVAKAIGLEKLVLDQFPGFLIFTFILAATSTIILRLLFLKLQRRLSPTRRALTLNQQGVDLFIIQKYEEAAEKFTKALRCNPKLNEALGNRGVTWRTLNHDTEALADLNEALRIDPTREVWLATRSMILLEQNQLDAAWEDSNMGIAMPNPLGECFYVRGTVQLARGQNAEALEDLEEALRRGITFPSCYAHRGFIWLETQKYDQAIEDFSLAIQLTPTESLYFNNRGTAYLRKGDYESALSDLNEAKRLNPEFAHPHKNHAWLQATCPDPKYRDGAKAVENAERALQLSEGQFPEWYEILAAAYAEAGNFEKAIEYQNRCLEKAEGEHALEMKKRLELYQSRTPYRAIPESPSTEQPGA